jgi:tRNA (guanine37-N1)-methyltransferase
MKVEPIMKAVHHIIKKGKRNRVVLFSPRGKQFDQTMAKRWLKYDQIIFICGRYEGVDERIADYVADEVVSVGPYVLNGGEVAAMVAIEAVSRLVPGFMHDADSQVKDDHAQYTKPEVVVIGRTKRAVPKVLLSGDHAKIDAWRKGKKP